ncbi:cupin domain-containing protein [Aphanothece minutissima]|nr:cupin domain-containing protein [Aphanothece minutissima]
MRSTLLPGDWPTVGIRFSYSVSHSPSREGFAMGSDRLFRAVDFIQPSDDEPIRSVIVETAEAVVVAWYVKPGQRIAAHVHPSGQDTWTILSGHGTYQTEASGSSLAITAGDVVVAPVGCVHGVSNHGQEPLTFISVVSPADAGFEPMPDALIPTSPLSS